MAVAQNFEFSVVDILIEDSKLLILCIYLTLKYCIKELLSAFERLLIQVVNGNNLAFLAEDFNIDLKCGGRSSRVLYRNCMNPVVLKKLLDLIEIK